MSDIELFLQNKCVSMFAKSADEKSSFVGSGFILELSDTCIFFITAGHLLKEIRSSQSKFALRSDCDMRSIRFGKSVRTSGSQEDDDYDDIDLAIIEIDESFRKTDAFEKHSIKKSQIIDRSELVEYEHLIVHGFPLSKNKKGSASGTTRTYYAIHGQEFDFTLLGKKSQDTHIALKWAKLVDTGKPVKHKPTHPRGLSGSPVWISTKSQDPSECKLVGVFIEYESKYSVGVSTNISIVLRFIEKHFECFT